MRWEEKLPGAEEAVRRWRCCGRGWWRCRSSRTAAPGGAAAVPNVRFPFLPMFRSSFSSLPSLLSVCFSFLCFFYVFLSSRFLSSFGSFSFRSLSFRVFLPFFSSLRRSWALFIEAKGAVFYSSHGEQPAGRPLGAAAEVRWVVRGGWSAIVFDRWAPGEREGPAKISKKSNIFPFFPAACSGGRRKMNSVVQNDTVLPFSLFFFFF